MYWSLAAGPRGAEGRRGAGGILLASRNAAVSPSPPFSAGRRGASRSPPHEAPAAGSRSGAGQMPESGDESQGIAVKGLLCPLRYPGSDLGRLRMIWRTVQNLSLTSRRGLVIIYLEIIDGATNSFIHFFWFPLCRRVHLVEIIIIIHVYTSF